MKKKLLLFVAVIMTIACIFAISANAETVTDDGTNITLGACVIEGLEKEIPNASNGFTFELDATTMTAKITKWANYATADTLVIPSTVTYNDVTYTVTAFDRLVYNSDDGKGGTSTGNYSVVNVFVPDTISAIPSYAFYVARALRYVYVGAGIEMVGEYAFLEGGFSAGKYYVVNGQDEEGNNTYTSIENTGVHIGNIEEFIFTSKKITTLKKQAFYNMEFAIGANIQLDLPVVQTLESGCFGMNPYHSYQQFVGTGIVVGKIDLRNIPNIADDAFYLTYGIKHVILYADQMSLFSSYSDRKKVNITMEIYGGETADTARTLGFSLMTDNFIHYGSANNTITYMFKGYIKAYAGVDGAERIDLKPNLIKYYFDSIDTLNFYIDSIKADTTNGPTTLGRYANHPKGYFVICDNKDGHKAINYKSTYESSVFTLVADTETTVTTPMYYSHSTELGCELDEADIYKCYVCDMIAKTELITEALGHEFDLENGATVVKITYVSFGENGIKHIKCARCDAEDTSTTAAPIITSVGYSVPVEQGKYGIYIGFMVDKGALAEYNKANDTTLEYGVIVANSEAFGDSVMTKDESGKYKLNNSKGVQIEISSIYNQINCKVSGFDETTAQALGLVMAVYFIDGDNVDYFQPADAEDKYENVTVGSDVLEVITVNKLLGKDSTQKTE